MGDESNAAGLFRKRFAYNFNQALDKRGITPSGFGRVKAVATLFRISTTSAHKWISGAALPEPYKLPEIVEELRCRLDDLFYGFNVERVDTEHLRSMFNLRVITNNGERTAFVQRDFFSSFSWHGELCSLQVDDDLMEPFVVHDEYVLFVPVSPVEHLSGVYVLFLNGKYSVRRLQQLSGGAIRLICENTHFSPEDVPAQQICFSNEAQPPLIQVGSILIVGRVVGRLIAR